jgi:hypothetical protein
MLQPLYPQGKDLSTHWLGGWVDCRARLDVVMKKKILVCQESNPSRPAHGLHQLILFNIDIAECARFHCI